jgi:prepilin-type N-terminal cleavage/methylation domain-containing protein/prepilin-type processing-associated H-X9-DG protein
MRNKVLKNSGFTLVELLVVISIIAMLLAILMPSLQKARDGAKLVMCQSNVKQQGVASLMYCQDNGDAIVPYFSGDEAKNTQRIWPTYLAPYIGSKKGAKSARMGGYWMEKNIEDNVLKVFKCPSQKDPFMWNYYLRYGINRVHSSNVYYQPYRVLKLSAIPHPSTRLQIADSMDTVPSSKNFTGNRGPLGFNNTLHPGEFIMPAESIVYCWPVGDRHKLGANAIFLDGHIKWSKYDDLMFRKTDTTSIRSQKIAMWDYTNSVYNSYPY